MLFETEGWEHINSVNQQRLWLLTYLKTFKGLVYSWFTSLIACDYE